MQKGTKDIGVLLAVALVGLAAVVVISSKPTFSSRRGCGHPDERFSSAEGFYDWVTGTTHCCYGGKVIADFRMFQVAQRMFRDDTQRFATNMVELLPYLGGSLRTNDFTLKYTATSDQWFVSVDQTQSLPGYYLLTMDGRVYFNDTGTATTNDLCINSWKID